jgi:hypothetical protein
MLVRPPLARRTVHVVIRQAVMVIVTVIPPATFVFCELTMELSAPLRVCAGSCQYTSPDIVHLPRCTHASRYGSDKPYLPYGSQVITHTSTGSTLRLEDLIKLCDPMTSLRGFGTG